MIPFMEDQSNIPDKETGQNEFENGYSPNRRMPRFVGSTEIRRLSKVIEEKNSLIEKFRKYDEERKAYYADFMEEYESMKESFDQFTLELKNILDDEGREPSEYKKVLRLYRNWLTYKNNAEHYKDKLASARESVREIKDDVRKLEEVLGQLDLESMSGLEHVVSRMFAMRKHLDTLQSKMLVQ